MNRKFFKIEGTVVCTEHHNFKCKECESEMSKEIQMWPSDEEDDYHNEEDELSKLNNEDDDLQEAMKEMLEWQKSNMMPMTYNIH